MIRFLIDYIQTYTIIEIEKEHTPKFQETTLHKRSFKSTPPNKKSSQPNPKRTTSKGK